MTSARVSPPCTHAMRVTASGACQLPVSAAIPGVAVEVPPTTPAAPGGDAPLGGHAVLAAEAGDGVDAADAWGSDACGTHCTADPGKSWAGFGGAPGAGVPGSAGGGPISPRPWSS